ncbi:hypothetical protein BJ508DRAFT_315181 [Ascobolus immersus RN42]|uniref:Uncharacterized protein n=1 Tax=Ascobolus immersus RN42 TaxID=1160509 RepID=A0A3N4HBX8_ASCIM|nr:hypothetical protein BJ508DRAFT_315181 [Ascobolus immersus RN42]
MKFPVALPLLAAASAITPAFAAPVNVVTFADAKAAMVDYAKDLGPLLVPFLQAYGPQAALMLSAAALSLALEGPEGFQVRPDEAEVPKLSSSPNFLTGHEAHRYLLDHGESAIYPAKRSEPFRITQVFSSKESADCVRAGKKCNRKPRPVSTQVTLHTRKCSRESKYYKDTLIVERVWLGDGAREYYVCG